MLVVEILGPERLIARVRVRHGLLEGSKRISGEAHSVEECRTKKSNDNHPSDDKSEKNSKSTVSSVSVLATSSVGFSSRKVVRCLEAGYRLLISCHQ